jgi:3-polyprenyl-4-hydroxybenzoate decarboxylase
VVQIKQRYPGHARNALHVASNCQGGAYAGKWTVVVDDDIDAGDLDQVLWAMSTRFDPMTDIDLIQKAWASKRDPLYLPGNFHSGRRTGTTRNSRACFAGRRCERDLRENKSQVCHLKFPGFERSDTHEETEEIKHEALILNRLWLPTVTRDRFTLSRSRPPFLPVLAMIS